MVVMGAGLRRKELAVVEMKMLIGLDLEQATFRSRETAEAICIDPVPKRRGLRKILEACSSSNSGSLPWVRNGHDAIVACRNRQQLRAFTLMTVPREVGRACDIRSSTTME